MNRIYSLVWNARHPAVQVASGLAKANATDRAPRAGSARRSRLRLPLVMASALIAGMLSIALPLLMGLIGLGEFIAATFRVLLEGVILTSCSFVLGSVVAYQYHSAILKFSESPDTEREYNRIGQRWYTYGPLASLAVFYLLDYLVSMPIRLVGLMAMVCALWLGGLINFERTLRDELTKNGCLFQFRLSCLSLAVVSAFTGAAVVGQMFQWLANQAG